MADPTKAALWGDADAYVAPIGTALPTSASDPWPSGWTAIGLLDGAAGFAHTRTEDRAKKAAWGHSTVRQSRKNFDLTVGFSMLEYNDTTKKLIWPGSSGSALKIPVPEPVLLGFETREGLRVMRRITKNYAEVDVDSFTETEEDLANFPAVATIYADPNKQLWVEYDTGARTVTALAITGTPPTVDGAIGKLTATATFSPSGSADVSHLAAWSSSDTGVATVIGGFVTGVAAGTATITAAYGGEDDSESVTIT